MKKTIKILGFVTVFMALLLLHSCVSATTGSDIVMPVESKIDVIRTNKDNSVTVQLKEGEYYQETSKLSATLQEVITGTDKRPAGILFYIPVPSGYGTTWSYAKTYEGSKDTYLYTTTFVDENFVQVPLQSGNASANYSTAKYVQGYVTTTATAYQNNQKEGVSVFTGGKKTFGVIYYNSQDKEVATEEYNIKILPKFSLKELKVEMPRDNYSNIIYDGYNERSYTQYIFKGQQFSIKTSRINQSLDVKEDLTSQTVLTSETPSILEVNANGTVTAKAIGVGKLKVTAQGVSTEVTVNVEPKVEYKEALTEQDVEDLIAYAKAPFSGDNIYYRTLKDTVVPAKLLKAAKELNKSLSIASGTDKFEYIWTFKPEDITDTSKGFDMKIERVGCFIEKLKDKKGIEYFDFKHNGALPGKANISLFLLDDDTVEYDKEQDVYFYYYNEELKKCEYVSTVTKVGYYMNVTIDHCCKYLTSEEPLDDSLVYDASRKLDGEPKAGEEATINYIYACYSLMIMTGVGIITLKIKE